MSKRNMPDGGRRRIAIKLIAGLLTGVSALTAVSIDSAEAWHRHRHAYYHHVYRHHFVRYARHLRHVRAAAAESPRFAALVIDGNTGRELYGRDEDALRHPASITKVMTLYLLFEQLQRGKLDLDSRIPISEHAALQAPTKIGLRPGQTIDVDNAIKSIVTQSANDIAVAIAEAIGGSESRFAEMMTAKAHALGMTHTHYANASGLPNDAQLTTAHDLAILGRDIQARFPQYYRYFSIRHFAYHGVPYHNHNHLLGNVEGVDGIKTGYTRASGFNLMTSVKRDGHYIIAVVLGGASSASRDRMMASLIEDHIDDGATGHAKPMVAELTRDDDRPAPVADKEDRSETEEDAAQAATETSQGDAVADAAPEAAAPRPVPLSGAVEHAADQAPTPMPVVRPRPAFVSGVPKAVPLPTAETDADADAMPRKRPAFDGTTAHASVATATPSSLGWIVGPQPLVRESEPKSGAKITARATDMPEPRVIEARASESRVAEAEAPEVHHAEAAAHAPDTTGTVDTDERPTLGPKGWMIQIGATDDAEKAGKLLARAQAEGPRALGKAKPFTEKIRKGSETLYRARFAGLEADAAEAVCKSLKRSGFACFATRN